jgi:hypothetical protein
LCKLNHTNLQSISSSKTTLPSFSLSVTAGGREWADSHIGQDKDRQPLWPTVTIEARYLQPILEGIQEDGLVCSFNDAPQRRRSSRRILRQEAEAMLRESAMPSLETVLEAVAEVRQRYSEQIKVSRKRRHTLS